MGAREAEERFIDDVKEEMRKRYKSLSDRNIVIWGIGDYGKFLYEVLSSMGMKDNIVAFCDDRDTVKGSIVCGKIVSQVSDIYLRFPNAVYLIASSAYKEIKAHIPNDISKQIEIYELEQMPDRELEASAATELSNLRSLTEPLVCIKKWLKIYNKYRTEVCDKLNTINSFLEDDESKLILKLKTDFFFSGAIKNIRELPVRLPQYFSKEYLPTLSDDEIFVDVGGYIGDTIESFVDKMSGRYNKILCFEPDVLNYNICKETILKKNIKRVELNNCVIGSSHGDVPFNSNGKDWAGVREGGNLSIKSECLDDYYNFHPTFIKMDIEGYEMEALKGAERIIRELKPKLAICIYHKPFDFYDIPMFIKKLVPEYKFKIRHHLNYLTETVLYAWVD